MQFQQNERHAVFLLSDTAAYMLSPAANLWYNMRIISRKAGPSMAETIKTNVMRILDREGVPHRVHFYDPEKGIDGLSVARQLGQDPQSVFKTLVTQGKSRAFYVFVIPVGATLSLKRAAAACGEKAIEMIPQKILLPTTGYIHGGCSPIGMKKAFPTYIDETAQLFDTLCVSAGKIGAQVELAPDALLALTGAKYAELTD